MADFKVATWNLFQFAEPGTYWYENDENNDYEPDQWAEKLAWMQQMLSAIDADIIGFQEVFSTAAFEQFMRANGYPHVAFVDEAAVSPDDPSIFIGPVNAIASRLPFAEAPTALELPADIPAEVSVRTEFSPRRAIVRAVVDIPEIGATSIYVCHFKSKGAFVDADAIAALPDWKTRFREHLRSRAVKGADQIVRRSAEAAAVYLAAMEEVETDPQKPVIVMGDLNDTPSSPTLRIATQQEWIRNIARRRRSGIESNADKAWNYTWQLFDSYGLPSNQSPAERPPTHAGGYLYAPETLDYVLVSNGLNQNNPRGVAEVTEHRIFADHLPDNDRLRSSDHAIVRVTLRPREES